MQANKWKTKQSRMKSLKALSAGYTFTLLAGYCDMSLRAGYLGNDKKFRDSS